MDLVLSIRASTGAGRTALAAFDDALLAAGVANLNLLRLSSVIPAGSVVQAEVDHEPPVASWGDVLFAVWAFESAAVLGEEAWAGVAWAQVADGRGVFVEHEGHSEQQVESELEASLDQLCASRSLDVVQRGKKVIGVRCEGEPVAALVIAPYLTASWDALGSAPVVL